MVKKKKFISALLAVVMVFGVLTIAPISVSAATSSIKTQDEAVTWLNAQNGASYDFGNFYDEDGNYWGGTQCVEFVRAYVNWLVNGNAWTDAWGGGTNNADTIWQNSLWSRLGWNVYYNSADFMPMPGDIFSSGGCHTGVVISSDLNTAVVADSNARNSNPYDGDSVWIHTITWRSASSNAAYGATHFIRPVFKSNAPHTHNYNTYVYYWKSHPHYNCYKCSCGDIKENRNETRVLDTCSQCIAEYKTVASINKSEYKLGEDVIVSWKKRDGATHYNVVLYKKNSDGNYKWYKTKFELKDLSYRISSLPVGEYSVFVQTYNSNYWTADKSDWFHADGDNMYFTVADNVLPDNVSLNKTSTTLIKENSEKLIPALTPANATTSYTWSSSDTSVATVDSNGIVTAKGAGTAVITATTSNGKTATCEVTVKLPQSERTIENIQLISQADKTFSLGQEIYPYSDIEGFEFEITYTDGSKETVTYHNNYLSNEYVSYYVDSFSWRVGDFYRVGENIISLTVDDFDLDMSIFVKDESISEIEITKLPDKTEYIKDIDYGSIDLSGLEMQISCVGGISWTYKENDIFLDDDPRVYIVGSSSIDEMPLGKNTIKLDYRGWQATFDINVVEDPNPVTNIEVTKLPDKTFNNAVDPSWIDYEVNYEGNIEEISGINYLELCENYLINKNMKGTEITVYYKDGTNKVFKITNNCTLQGSASLGWYYLEEENDRQIIVRDLGNYEAEVEFEGVTTTFSVSDDNDDTIKVTGIEIINGPNSPIGYYDFIDGNLAVIVRGTEILIYTADGINIVHCLGVPDYTTYDEDTWKAYYGDMLVVTYFRSTGQAQIECKGFVEEFTPAIAVTSVSSGLLGDANSDGEVNAKDRMMLTRYLAKWSGYENIDNNAADVNNDGEVNAKDRMILTRHLAKWQGYETLPYTN